ncbi:amino acid adenylation domain-containing protein [Pseudomonas sp. SDO528_S397]
MTQIPDVSSAHRTLHPLTAPQLDIWLDQSLHEQLPLYNIGGYLRIQGPVDVDRLQAALDKTVAQHDALRTRLVPGSSEHPLPRQFFLESAHLPLVFCDVSANDDPERAALAFMERDLQTPFSFDGPLLLRVSLVKVQDNLHFLLFNGHHLVVDGWALALITRGVGQAYTQGPGAETPVAPSFQAYVQQERSYTTSSSFAHQRQYWLDKYRVPPEPLLSPRLRRESGQAPAPSQNHAWRLPRALFDRLGDLAAESAKATIFHVMLGAFYSYFARLTQRDDLVVGIPLLNRANAAQKATVGAFASMSAVRLNLGTDLSFSELVGEIALTLKKDYRHQRYPLSELSRELAAEGLARRQLFDLAVSYETDHDTYYGQALGTPFKLSNGYEQRPLALHVRQTGPQEDVWLHLIYNEAYFDAHDIQTLQHRLTHILQTVALDFDAPCDALPLMSPAEQQRLEHWNSTDVDYDPTLLLHRLIEAQVEAHPDAIAVQFEGQTLTYDQLNRHANQVAHALLELGVVPDDRVAICLERSLEMVTGLLGILKAGAAYVPMDPQYPADRLAYMLDNSAPCALLTTQALLARLPAVTAPVIRVDADRARLARQPEHNPDPLALGLTARHLAYVIYTSGSTGQPKGVMNQHDGVVNRLLWAQQAYGIDEHSRILQKTPFSFDVSVWEFFLPLLSGARLVVASVDGHRDPDYLMSIMASAGISVLHFVPSMLQLFLDKAEQLHLPDLKQVLCSGEALPPALQARFFARLPDVQLHNLYGPTEAAIDVSAWHCQPDLHDGVVPIGKPIANIQLHILDSRLQPLPVGSVGEIHIGGIGVARGYLNRPDLTAERFIHAPFQQGAKARLYKTGDLGRWLHDGSIEYLGRTDFQVKIRGLRIELSEIEAHLNAMDPVKDVVVVARHDAQGDAYLGAYMLAHPGYTVSPPALLEALALHVPDYMVPKYLMVLEQFPLNVNGKLDRAALPAPLAAPANPHATAPRSPLEQALAALWRSNLNLATLGIHDNYFRLGGDSLKVIHLQVKAREQGIALTLAQLYQHPTIARLAHSIQTSGPVIQSPSVAHALPFVHVDESVRLASAGLFDDVFPASQLQVGMIYHSMMHPGSALYHDIFRYHLRLRWDAKAWDLAVAALVRRHPALRMSFDTSHVDVPMARVHTTAQPQTHVTDVSALSPEARAQLVDDYMQACQAQHLDWQQAPLYTFAVFAGADEIELVLSFHHAILDGWSVATLMRELVVLYRTGDADALAPLVTTPADFITLELDALTRQEHSRFWLDYLQSPPVSSLLNWTPALAPDTQAHRSAYREIPAAEAAQLEAFCLAHDLPLRAVLLTAHCFAQAILANEQEVLCGVISHGRPEFEDAAAVLGLFLNTLALRFQRHAASWLDLIGTLMEHEQQVAAHRRYPFALIHRETGASVNVVFNYVDFYILDDLRVAGEEILIGWDTLEASNYDLLTTAGRHPFNGSLMLKMDYSTARVATRQVETYAQYLLQTLEWMMADPHAAPHTPRLLPAPPQAHVYPAGPHAHDNISSVLLDSFARHADLPALGQLSYRQLADASAQLAHWLHRQGIGQGHRVALMLPRADLLIVAMLGVVQAGATYVPIDLSYPAHRAQQILTDAQPRLVLFADESALHLQTHAEQRPWHSVVAEFEPDLTPCHRLVATLARQIASSDDVYVLYTSGSTGRPKGVAMPHQALTNLIAWQNRRYHVEAGATRTLQYSPISFDVSFQEILSALASGAELVMIDETLRYDFVRLLKFIDARAINALFLPYVALQGLAEVAVQLGIYPASLQRIHVAGEQLKITAEIRGFLAHLQPCSVDNHYGPTEAHVVSACLLDGDSARWPTLPPIGLPIDGVRLHVLDAAGKPCPVGVCGDLLIEGVCLANGYWNQPALTDERFCEQPLAGVPTRLYKTGDIAYALPSGDLVYQGRSDVQVKIRGYRVELGEIEVALLAAQHGGAALQQAAVIDKSGSDGARYLVGFVEAAVGQEPDLERLKAELRLALPEYMVPTTLVTIARIPVGPTGKIDRKALQAIEVQQVSLRPFTAPGNPRETLLQTYWQDILGTGPISIHDNFFEMGGNSLKAVRLIAMLAKQQGLELPLSDFIQAPTIAEFAEVWRLCETGQHSAGALVDFKNAPGAPKLFLVHPIGGHVLCYAALAQSLQQQVHLYGLQATGTWDSREPLASVQAQADHYADAIERAAPEGPLHIGGWSYGGFVAYALARTLEQRGRQVSNVFLLDTIMRIGQGTVQVERSDFMNWFMWELLSGDGQKAYAHQELDFSGLSEPEAFAAIRERGIALGSFDAHMSAQALLQLYKVFAANWHALMAYEFTPLALPLTLFAAELELPEVLRAPHTQVGTAFRDPYRGWQAISPQVERIAVQGDHLTMMRTPNIEGVGAVIHAKITTQTVNHSLSADAAA